MLAGFASMIGWSVIKESLPWKWIGVGLAALFVTAIAGFAYLYVSGMQADLVKAKADLATRTLERDRAEKANADLRINHAYQMHRVETLSADLKAVQETADELRSELDQYDLEGELERDPTEAVADLNRRIARSNRLLEARSGSAASPVQPAPGSKAGAPR